MRSPAFALFPSRRSLFGLLGLLAAVLFLTLAAVTAAAQTEAPTVTGVAVVSDAGDDDTYGLDDVIRVRVTFSQAVEVTGRPRLKIDMDPAAWGQKWATYEGGSGTASLAFAHRVVQPNLSTQGIAVVADSLELNGGSIASASVAADLAHVGLAHDGKHKVDWTSSSGAPTVTGVAVSSDAGDDGTYGLDDVIRITLSFSEAVEVTGTPQVAIDMDPAAWGRKQVNYESGGGTASLIFAHTVAEPNLSTRGIAVLANTLALNGGAIRSAASQTNASLAHGRLNHDSNHRVDWQQAAQTESACELTAPAAVSGLGIARGAVIKWTAPAGQAGACEVTGFTVGATDADGQGLEEALSDPQVRRHVLRGLLPGQYRFHVRIDYAEGPSERLITARQNTVPATCNVTLTVQPHAHNAISGRWTNVAGSPTGCVVGPTIEYQFKRSVDDYFLEYGLYPNLEQLNPDLPSFIGYGLRPYVGYDFRIVAVDAAGQKHASNVASTTIVSDDPSARADANSPGGVRAYANNGNGVSVLWDLPPEVSGRTLSAYVVEWKSGSDTPTTVVLGSTGEGSSGFLNRRYRIRGLTKGRPYTVRVAARSYLTADPNKTTSDAWSAPTPRVTAWSEPRKVWFVDTTPVFAVGRIFMATDTNKVFGTSTVCHANSDGGEFEAINCPTLTTVSLLIEGGTMRAYAEATLDGVTTASATSIGEEGSPSGGFGVFASGGDGTLLVEWGTAAVTYAVGTLDAYIVQHRLQNADATWPAWSSGTVKAATDRTHTFTGLTDGTYQVRVRARSDGDDGDPETTDTPRLGFTTRVLTVPLSSDYDEAPGVPGVVRITPGDSRSLVVEWEAPLDAGPLAHAYQVRHRLRGTETYTNSERIYPSQTRRRCPLHGECTNPRRYEITGLTGGQEYDVAIRAFNANGAGEWLFTLTQNIPND